MSAILNNPHFRLLGYNRGFHYFLPLGQGQVYAHTARSLGNPANWADLGPLSFWEREFPGKTAGVNPVAAVHALIEASTATGVYDPDRIRGRGAWLDDGRTVLHMGGRFVIDGLPSEDPPEGAYLYERAADFGIPAAAPCGPQPMLAELAKAFNWTNPRSANVLAGWCAAAFVPGAMINRPTLYLTAPSRSGKTTIIDQYIRRLLGPLALSVASQASTEAGIRQLLASDSRPVTYDEPETDSSGARERVQAIVDLARVSFSEDEARIAKGTTDHRGTTFALRSMFVLASVKLALRQEQDVNRAAILRINRWNEADTRIHMPQLDAAIEKMGSLFTPQFRAGLLARLAGLIPVIRANAETCRRAITTRHGSGRLGQVFSTIIAGHQALLHERRLTEAEAALLLDDFITEEAVEEAVAPEMKPILDIASVPILFQIGSERVDIPLSECIMIATNKLVGRVHPDIIHEFLRRRGLVIQRGFLWISNQAELFARMVDKDGTGASLASRLLQVPGAVRSNGPMRFAAGAPNQRAVGVPLALFPADTRVPQVVVPFPTAMQGD